MSNSEKITDCKMLNIWNNIFNCYYNTSSNKDLFDSKIPDGWFIYNDNLFIIENKKNIKDKINGLKQLKNYYINCHKDNFNKIYLILGLGTNKDFNYNIYYIRDNKIFITKKTLEEIKDELNYKKDFDLKEVHELNQYLYDNGINLPKSQKTLFIASILICLKIKPNFVKEYDKGYLLADKMIQVIQEYYNDTIFSNMFNFIKKSIHNDHLLELFKKLELDVKIYGKDILNQFYSEFCIFDRNNDSSLGVVLTPHDIVKIMIKELNLKETDILLDFCTGTGSFLIEGSKYTKYLVGCENNDERYSLAKCNFILNDLDYSHLYYNSCFNQQFDKVDKVIINPPFSCSCPDATISLDETNWKLFKAEQKFVLYQVQCLKENGIGCCIIPRSNFNNSCKKSLDFKTELLKYIAPLKIYNCNSKVFVPNASVECTILIFKKSINLSNEVEIIDYSDDGYNIKKSVRMKDHNPNPIKQYKILNKLIDWNYEKEFEKPKDLSELIMDYNLNYIYTHNTIEKNKGNRKININIVIPENLELKEWKKIKIKDYFKIIKSNKIFQINNTNKGYIPLISSSCLNNGIVKFIDDYSYDNECITIARNGSVGASFYHNCKIGVTTDLIIIKNIKDENLHIIAMMLNYYLPQKYSYSNKITTDKLLNEEVFIPIFN